jgi:plastocyanin
MIPRLLTVVSLAILAGCGGSPTSPTTGGTGGVTGGTGGVTGGGSSAPATAAVTVGNIFFKSGQNGSQNPATVTVAVGGTVTWTWTGTGATPHSVQSVGSTIFRNSTVQTGDGSTYQVVFSQPGTYQYQCAVHGAAMSGTIVVQ